MEVLEKLSVLSAGIATSLIACKLLQMSMAS